MYGCSPGRPRYHSRLTVDEKRGREVAHELLHEKSYQAPLSCLGLSLNPVVGFMIQNVGTHAWSSSTLLLLHFGNEGKGLMGENTQCLFSPVQSLISGWEKQQPVTFQLFLVCTCICECWICRTVCLESSHSSGQILQTPLAFLVLGEETWTLFHVDL